MDQVSSTRCQGGYSTCPWSICHRWMWYFLTAYVKSCSSDRVSLIQSPFARAKVGICFLSRESRHTGDTFLQWNYKTGPFNSVTESEVLNLAFLITPSTLSKLILSTSDRSSISQLVSIFHKPHNQILQTHLEKYWLKNLLFVWHVQITNIFQLKTT